MSGLTFQTIFDEAEVQDSVQALKNCQNVLDDNSTTTSQNSFTAINQQLQDLLQKINNRESEEPSFSSSYYEPIDVTPTTSSAAPNLEEKIDLLTNKLQYWQTKSEANMQHLLNKIENMEHHITDTSTQLDHLRQNQRSEFISFHSSFNKQMKNILEQFEEHATKAVVEKPSQAKPKNWEEALNKLAQQEEPINHNTYVGSFLDDAAMQRILQRSQMYHEVAH